MEAKNVDLDTALAKFWDDPGAMSWPDTSMRWGTLLSDYDGRVTLAMKLSNMTPQELVRYTKRAPAAERGVPRYLGRDEETGAYLCADNFGLFLVARRFTQRDGKQRAEDVELRPCKLLRPTKLAAALSRTPLPVCATFTDEAGFLYQQFLNM